MSSSEALINLQFLCFWIDFNRGPIQVDSFPVQTRTHARSKALEHEC